MLLKELGKLETGCVFCVKRCMQLNCPYDRESRMIKAEYVQHWGNDLMVVNSARVSFGNEKDSVDKKDIKLINYLAKHKHMTPFEHMGLTVKVTCPLYIRSQIMRHRTFAYNEISRRYTSKDLEFYMPEYEDYRGQSTDNKQCSDGTLSQKDAIMCNILMQKAHTEALKSYERMIALGLSREQARGILPQNLLTEFYMSGNLRNWAHFLSLREGKDAQKEVRVIAEDVRALVDKHFEESAKALRGLS